MCAQMPIKALNERYQEIDSKKLQFLICRSVHHLSQSKTRFFFLLGSHMGTTIRSRTRRACGGCAKTSPSAASGHAFPIDACQGRYAFMCGAVSYVRVYKRLFLLCACVCLLCACVADVVCVARKCRRRQRAAMHSRPPR